MPTTPDFILIPVVLGPGKAVDMWLRAASVEAFQPAGPNPMGVRSYLRTKHSAEMIPTTESCARLLAALRGEQATVADNIVMFPGINSGAYFTKSSPSIEIRPPTNDDDPSPNNDGEPA